MQGEDQLVITKRKQPICYLCLEIPIQLQQLGLWVHWHDCLQQEWCIGRGGRRVQQAEVEEEIDPTCDCCGGPREDSAGSHFFKRLSFKMSMPAWRMQQVVGSSG